MYKGIIILKQKLLLEGLSKVSGNIFIISIQKVVISTNRISGHCHLKINEGQLKNLASLENDSKTFNIHNKYGKFIGQIKVSQ